MLDPTEAARRAMVGQMQADGPATRETLEAVYGRVWNTQELGEEFEVLGFLAPFVVVRRKRDGCKGTLTFQPDPRLYFDFEADKPS